MKHLKHLLYLRRLKVATKALRNQITFYEELSKRSPELYLESYRRAMLNDLYKMKDKYNTEKYSWMKRI